MSMLDIHRAALDHINESYHEFLLRYNSSNLTVYGFVEGKDDPSFYRSIIERFLPEKWNIEIFIAGSRDKVIDAEQRFDWTQFSRQQIAFFVDQDLVTFLDPSKRYEENIYVSDGYSIENSITTNEVFIRLLQEVHNIIDWSEAERGELSEHFSRQIHIFQEIFCPLMAQIALWRSNGVKANLNNLDIPSIVSLTDGVCAVRADYKEPSARIERLCQCVGAAASPANELSEMEFRFRKADGPGNLTRGKYLIWFLAAIVNNVHAAISKYVSYYRTPPRSRMQFGPANVMIVAAPRARIPDSLRIFLEKTYIKFIADNVERMSQGAA